MNINEYLEKKRIEIESNVFYTNNFNTAEIDESTLKEYQRYQYSLKYYRDLKNSLDTAKEEGITKGIEQGRKEGLAKAKKNETLKLQKTV